MGHTIHAFKRNVNMTYVVMDNHVYGLTKGQASPRSDIGFVTKQLLVGRSSLHCPFVKLRLQQVLHS